MLGTAAVAPAGNHLLCYKGKDSTGAKHKYSGGVVVSNTGLNPIAGCVIATPPKICCDAVDKIGFLDENSNPAPGGGPTGNTTKFCCYKVKCPKGSASPAFVAHDQFGVHSFAVKTTSILCAPASPSGAFLD